MADERIPTLGSDDKLLQEFLPSYLTQQNLDLAYQPRDEIVIALDEDDVPYYGTVATDGGSAVPVGVDTDGVPYVMV